MQMKTASKMTEEEFEARTRELDAALGWPLTDRKAVLCRRRIFVNPKRLWAAASRAEEALLGVQRKAK
jgi:hypothetical protein